MSSPRIYNPAQLSGDDLERSFLARQETLADILRTIREQAPDAPCQHTLLIGPRGMGKTTMGLMCLRRIEQDPTLAAHWQPVPFHEESYGIGDLADLWLTALRHLAHATGDSQWAEQADALIASEPDTNRQAAYALSALLDFHQETGKRLLLFIENLDQVLAQIDDERQIHELRAVLIQHTELLLLGSANTVFNAIRSHSHPFYEFFRLVFLRELDAGETRLLLKVAVGEQSQGGFQDAMIEETGRLETIRRLTGGNPRLLKLACRMMVESPLGTAFEDLERLIDEQTPYFKGRIEELPAQLRRVFHCLAEGWRPLLAKEVAVASKLSSSHASAQLRQLVEKGYAKECRQPHSKRVHYEVVDRFYNIYYLLRLSHRSRDRFERLVQFLQDLFGVINMRLLFSAALSELREGKAKKERDDLISVLAEHVASDRGFAGRAGWMREATKVAGYAAIEGFLRKGDAQLRASLFEEAAATYDDVLNYAGETPVVSGNNWRLLALLGKVISLTHLQRYYAIVDDDHSWLAQATTLNDDESKRNLAALYFLCRGNAHGALDEAAEAIEMWTHCADLVNAYDKPSLQGVAATALFLVAQSHAMRDEISETLVVIRKAWKYDRSDLLASDGRLVLPLAISARQILLDQQYLGKTGREKAPDLGEAERDARRAWKISPESGIVLHVFADVLAAQGRWEESLSRLAEAARQFGKGPGSAHHRLAESLIRALATGHASRVKDIMADANLAKSMEPLWHATCAELGRELGPLPAEIADAVAAVRARVETVRNPNARPLEG